MVATYGKAKSVCSRRGLPGLDRQPLRLSPKWLNLYLVFVVWVVVGARGQDAKSSSFIELTNRAWTQYNSSNWAAAEPLFRSALQSEPENLDVLEGYAGCLNELRHYKEAIIALRKLVKSKPKATNAYWGLGSCFYAEGEFTNAAESFGQYATLVPQSAAGFYWIYWSWNKEKNYPEAAAAIRRAIAIDPTQADYYVALGSCLGKLEQYPEAVQALNEAVSLDSRSEYAHSLLGCYSYRLENYPLSIAAYSQAVAMDPTNEEVRFDLGLSCYEGRDFSDAVRYFSQIATAEPTNFDAFTYLGYSQASLHNYDEATSAFQKALKLKPEDFRANLMCGANLLRAGRYAEAPPYFEVAHKVNQSDRYARRALFFSYVVGGQCQKAWELSPGISLVGGGLVLLTYFIGLALLWKFSIHPQPNTYPGLWFSLAWLFIFFEGQYAGMILLGFLSFAHLFEGPVTAIILAGAPVLFAAHHGFRFQPWGQPFAWPPVFGRRIIWLAILALGAMSLLNSCYSSMITHFTHCPVPLQDSVPLIKAAFYADPVTAFFAVVVVGPIVEEILFRGLVFGAMQRRLPAGLVIVLTALLFALVHMQWDFFIALFLMGVILGWLRWKSGSLVPSIFVHALNNGLSLLFLMLFEHSS